jgi:excisionase family DNA binding protein
MSSEMRLKKICDYCGAPFIAKQHRTRFCCHRCNQLDYKRKQRDEQIANTNAYTMESTQQKPPLVSNVHLIEKALINIKELSVVCGISERTLFRLIKSEDFPKMKVGKRLLFDKQQVLEYFNHKFGNP